MELLVILLIAAVVGWLAKSKKQTKKRGAHVSKAQQQSNQSTVDHQRQNTDETTQVITVNIDWSQVQKNAAAFNASRIKWSGKDYGPFPITKLTENQLSCLHDAVGRKKIVVGNRYEVRGDAPTDIAFHPEKTVSSLLKHGFLAKSEAGYLTCTDFGANAWENLR